MIELDQHPSGRHFLQIPGPSPVPDRILRAMSLPTIDHRGPEFGALAAERITDEELDEIKAMHFEMMAAYTRKDLSNYYRLNALIHNAIVAAAKNPVLTTTYNQVNARLQALRCRSNQDGEKWKAAMKEHEKMIEALSARDVNAMREVLGMHLRNKRDVVIDQIRRGMDLRAAQGAR